MRFCPLGVVISVALVGCIPNDDAGNAAFVSRVVPAVLGRKVRGAEELDVLTQVAQTYGREALVDVLMNQPEYVQYWSAVLSDDLEVQYGSSAWVFGQQDTCFDTANVVAVDDPVAAHDLNDFLVNTWFPTTTYSTSFTMLDALRAGILDDNLSGVYRAWLFPLVSHENADEGHGARIFNSAFLGRDRDCLTCHSSTWSTTDDVGDVDDWDRFAPFPIDVEGGLYKNFVAPSASCGTDVGCSKFQTYCAYCHDPDGGAEMGAVDGDSKRLAQRVRVLPDASIRAVMRDGTGNMADPSLPSADEGVVLDYLRRAYGSVDVTSRFFRASTLSTTAGYQPFGMSTDCSKRVIPNDTTDMSSNPAYWPRFADTGYGSPSVYNLSRVFFQGTLYDSTTYTSGATISYANGSYDAALINGGGNFAFAVAQRIVDNVLEEVWGERHTLGHGFERNAEGSLDRNLRALELMDQDFSLRYLVKSAVLSEHFNRRAPEDSFVGTTAYTLFMTLNPWAEVDPAAATGAHEEDANGQGDLVHRYTPDNLYWSVHHGLGWNEPELIPTSGAFPNYGFRENVGDYTAFYQRGTSKWSLSGLLYWEQAVGLCQATNVSTGSDWIELLLDEAYLSPASYTIEDLVKATHDRLLGTPELIPGEEAAILTMLTTLGFPSYVNLAVPLTPHPQPAMDAAIRTYCGGLLTTPDYLLGGLPGVDDLPPEWPVLEVCLPGEPCGAVDLCDYWADELSALGHTWTTCNSDEPPLIAPHDPTDWDAETVEDIIAAEHEYSTATDYDDEIAQAELDELERLALEDSATLAMAEEDALAEEERRKLGAKETCGSACDSIVYAWETVLTDEASDRAAAESLVEALSDMSPAQRWEHEPYTPTGDIWEAMERAQNAEELEEGLPDPTESEYQPNDLGEVGPNVD